MTPHIVFFRLLLGLGFFALVFNQFNHRYVNEHEALPGPKASLEFIHSKKEGHAKTAVLLGSSNILESLDCRLLDSITSPLKLKWYNLSQRGMRGEELMSTAIEFVEFCEDSSVDIMFVELLGSDLNKPFINWRHSRYVKEGDFLAIQFESMNSVRNALSIYDRIKITLEFSMMRLMHGFHFWLYPKPFDPRLHDLKGGSHLPGASWAIRTEQDSMVLELRQKDEEHFRLNQRQTFEGDGEFDRAVFESLVFPMWQLKKLNSICESKGIRLIPIFQPASGCQTIINPASKILKMHPIVLDGGMNPSPFITPELMADSRHLNARGAKRVTEHFGSEIITKILN